MAGVLAGSGRRESIPAPAATGAAARLRQAAGWYERNGYPAVAAALHRAGCRAEAEALVESRAEEMLAAGEATGVVALLGSPSGEPRSPRLQRIFGDALRMSGDAAAAARAFAPLLAEARRTGRWDAGLVWRAAMVRYLQGDCAAALQLLDLAPVAGLADRDEVEVEACRANALFTLGVEDDAAAAAASAVSAAEALGDDRAIASAYLAAANTSTGARKEAHLAQALVAAKRAGDVVQTARVLVNTAYGLLFAARYGEAQVVAAEALHAAERGTPPGILVAALHNLGDALTWLGRYDEAVLYFERSVAVCRRLGLQRTAMGLLGLAEVHRRVERLERSRTAYEEAVQLSRATGEAQVHVPALAGLARLRLEVSELPDAQAAAEEAERAASPEFASYALAARGEVALAECDTGLARERAAAAIRTARSARAVDGLADALELTAAAAGSPADARAALRDALAIWADAGAEPSADRVRVLLGRLPGADGSSRCVAREAARRLIRSGVTTLRGRPLHDSDSALTVDIRVLGRFEVRVDGRLVPLPAWRSRQARILVKILVSRRGRHVTRAELCELLWPDDEPTRTGHRLSVLLSAVRSVLDPRRAWPADHYLVADLCGVSLDVSHVSVDVERLLQDARLAAGLLRDGEIGSALEILSELDARYRGDAFEDEPYEEWADGLREEARATWLRSLRHLANLRRASGDHQDAAQLLLRLLVADPYDEPAHRALVDVLIRAGRHGEARRAFARWTDAMRSIAAPTPDPAVLRPDRGSRAMPQPLRPAPAVAGAPSMPQ